MPEKMLGIRDVLARNLKENRRKCGLTQEKLAEKAGISAHYTPEEALTLLRQDIVDEIEQLVVKTIKETLAHECKGKD